jgi:hypothetical protein
VPLTHQAKSQTCLFVIKFHPNIIYYDMCSISEYKQHKSYYHEPREQLSFRRNSPRGAAKLVVDLLSAVERDHFTTISDFGRRLGLWPSADRHGRAATNEPLTALRGSKAASAGADIAARRISMKSKTFR